MQVLYALHQFARVWQLRRELQAPGRRRIEVLRRWACWVLASEARTWIPLGAVTIAAFHNVAVEQGWGSALLAAPTICLFYGGVQWLRKRWGVTVKDRNRD
ncbi:hypothetical protein Misp02_62060 [Microtetraspora sp. NBRC 16547]|nr:hypothetical protein Misp02_62060 [Microtetraspora sp. NBRC 16547]